MARREMLKLTSESEAAMYRSEGLWKDQTIYERFRAAATRSPGKPAIVMGPRRWSYADVLETVERLASNLLALDLPGDAIVAVQLPNGPGLPLLHLALNRIGLLMMPMSDGYRELELAHLLKQGEVAAAIVPSTLRGHDYPAMWDAMRRDIPSLLHVLPMDDVSELLRQPTLAATDRLDARRSGPDAIAHIMLSSGTTSLPKISVFTSNNLLAMVDAFASMVA